MTNLNNLPKEIFIGVEGANCLSEWMNEKDIRYVQAQPFVSWEEIKFALEHMAEERKNCPLCQKNICPLHKQMSWLLEPFMSHETDLQRQAAKHYHFQQNREKGLNK